MTLHDADASLTLRRVHVKIFMFFLHVVGFVLQIRREDEKTSSM